MAKIINFPKGKLTAQEVLETALKDGQNLANVLIIGHDTDGTPQIWANSIDPAFMSITSLMVSDLALRSIRGEIVDK